MIASELDNQPVMSSGVNTDTDHFLLTGLEPDTVYSVTLVTTIFGGASIDSEPHTVRTEDGGLF